MKKKRIEETVTVDQLIEALELFKAKYDGGFPVITSDYDSIGDLELYDGCCFLMYKDLARLPFRPLLFEKECDSE